MRKHLNTLKVNDIELFSMGWQGERQTIFALIRLPNGGFFFNNLEGFTFDTYDQLLNENQTLEEVQGYVEYIRSNEEATVLHLGNIKDGHVKKQVEMIMGQRFEGDRTTDSFLVDIEKLANKIVKLSELQQKIASMVFFFGDIMNAYDEKGNLVAQNIIKCIKERFIVLPTSYEVTNSFDDEIMSREEVNGYLFELIVNEKHLLQINHNSENEPSTILKLNKTKHVLATKQIVQEVRSKNLKSL